MAGAARSRGVEAGLWLCPIEDRRGVDSARKRMLAGFKLVAKLIVLGVEKALTK